MRRALLFSLAIAFAIACGDSITEPIPTRTTAVTPAPSFATTTTEDGLSISTDKDDYSPGDTVHFTGSGWQPGDSLDVVLVDDAVTQETHTWAVGIADDGTFQDATYVVDTDDFGVTFTLTATSRATGRSLTVVFTDGNIRTRTNIAGVTANVTTRVYTNTTCSGTLSGTTTLMTNALTSVALGVNPGTSVKLTAANSSNTGSFISWTSNDAFTAVAGDPQSICVAGFNGNANHDFTANYQAVDLIVAKSHTGNFQVGVNGTYTLAVTNQGLAATSGSITLSDNLPAGLTFVSGSGSGWGNCTAVSQAVTCTRAGQIMPGNSSSVSLVVAVGAGATPSVTNTASVSGGSEPSGNAGNNSGSDATTVDQAVAGPTKLAFTGTFTAVAGECSSQITIQTQNASDAPTNPTASTTVNLSSNSVGGAFYTDAACATAAITSVAIPTTGNSVSFYYKDSNVGSPTLTAAATGLTSATQQGTISPVPGPTKLAFTTNGFTGVVGQCLGTIAVRTENASGAATNVTSSTTLSLATDGTGAFYGDADASCTTPLSPAELTIASGQSTASFRYKGTARGDGTHEVTVSAAGLTSAKQIETINKANQTIAFAALGDKTYGDADFSVSATASSGLTVAFAASGNCTVSGTTLHITGAGNCTVTASQDGDDNYNEATPVAQQFAIGKATLTVTVDDKSRSYGAQNPTFTGTLGGVVNNEITVSYSTAASPESDVGKYEITVQLLDPNGRSSNYNVPNPMPKGELEITQAPLGITAENKQKTYDGQPFTPFTVAYSGFVLNQDKNVLGGTLDFTGNAVAAVNAASYTITPFGLTSTNYKINFYDGTLTIDPRPITIKANNAGPIYYDDPLPTFTWSIVTGDFKGADQAAFASTVTFTLTPGGNPLPVGTHTITPAWTYSNSNYAISLASPGTGSITVNPWTLKGFYQPVDMAAGGMIWNTVKGGFTVPLKFEVFVGNTEKTDVAIVLFFTQKLTCPADPPTDQIEVVSTGGTSLRYDPVAGQFIQNWQTPKAANACYKVTMTTQDGSKIEASFKTKS